MLQTIFSQIVKISHRFCKFDSHSWIYNFVGDSAGGNLAAAVSYALAYQRSSGVRLQFQALFYPTLQAFDFRLPSFIFNNENTFSTILSTDMVARAYLLYWKGKDAWKHIPTLMANNHTTAAMKQSNFANYVSISLLPEEIRRNLSDFEESIHEGDGPLSKEFESVMLNPLFSPLMAEDLSAMPTTFLSISGYDVLRDDGLMYAERLMAAGVSTRLMTRNDAFHGVFSFTRLQNGREVLRDMVHFLKSTH